MPEPQLWILYVFQVLGKSISPPFPPLLEHRYQGYQSWLCADVQQMYLNKRNTTGAPPNLCSMATFDGLEC